MQLLHSEINVEPGQQPRRDFRQNNAVGFGRAVLHLENNTPRENGYRVEVSSEDPDWNPRWVRVRELDNPDQGQHRRPERGLHNEWVKVFVSSGSSWDVAIDVEVDQTPEARAGVYRAKVVVEVSVGASTGKRLDDLRRVFDLTIVIRPFYDWTASIEPKEQKAGVFKRRREFEARLENRGNDWLYVDIEPVDQETLQATADVQRVALAPPQRGGSSIRRIPVRVRSRKRIWRGDRDAVRLKVNLRRIDAPSIPPLSKEATEGATDANLGAAVQMSVGQVGAQPTEMGDPGTLINCPLIYQSVSGFFQAILNNARGLWFMVLGLLLMVTLLSYLVPRVLWGFGNGFKPNSSSWARGQDLYFQVKAIDMTGIDIYDYTDEVESAEPLVRNVKLKRKLSGERRGKCYVNMDDALWEILKDSERVRFKGALRNWIVQIFTIQTSEFSVKIEGGGLPYAKVEPNFYEGENLIVTLARIKPEEVTVLNNGQEPLAYLGPLGNDVYKYAPPKNLGANKPLSISVLQTSTNRPISIKTSAGREEAVTVQYSSRSGEMPGGNAVPSNETDDRSREARSSPAYESALAALSTGAGAPDVETLAQAADDLDANDVPSIGLKAYLLAAAGRDQPARNLLRRLPLPDPEAGALDRIVRARLELRSEGSVALIDEATDGTASSPLVSLLAALWWTERGKPENASAYLNQLQEGSLTPAEKQLRDRLRRSGQ